MTHSQVAIVIVTYQSGDVIADCLSAAIQLGAQIVVVDNASGDGTQAAVGEVAKTSRQVRLIANSQNRGFAAAVNQGVHATSAPFVLLVNPDAVIETGIERMLEACQESRTGAVGGKLTDWLGVQQKGFNVRRFPTPLALIFENLLLNRLWPRNPVNWRFRCFDLDLSEPAEIEQPAGAFLMFRREAWQQLGGWDEGFFPLWFDDVDFCKRLHSAGLRILYEPCAVARHRGAHSIKSIEPGTKTEYWYRSLLRYSIKHHSPAGRVVTSLSVIAGSCLRVLLSGVQLRRHDFYRVNRNVVSMAFRSIWKRQIASGERLFLTPAMRNNSVLNDAK